MSCKKWRQLPNRITTLRKVRVCTEPYQLRAKHWGAWISQKALVKKLSQKTYSASPVNLLDCLHKLTASLMTDYSTAIIGLIAFTGVVSAAVIYVLAQPSDLPVVKKSQARNWSVSIDKRCKEQQNTAERMLSDFNFTRPGSDDQLRALKTLTFLLSMWPLFLSREMKRMDSANFLNQQTVVRNKPETN